MPVEGGGTYWLARLPYSLGKFIALTGKDGANANAVTQFALLKMLIEALAGIPLSNHDLYHLDLTSHCMYAGMCAPAETCSFLCLLLISLEL
tara:strand:+ start:659 stop:934 length:276 start_codon:yes stop_codon:yes gene_type:complete